MTLRFADVLNALDQLATVSTSHTHQLALQAAIEAVHFKHAIESTIERHYQDGAQPLKTFQVPGNWSADEDVQLRQEFEAGMTLDLIGSRHHREPLHIAERLRDLHILTEQAVEEIRTARARQSAKFDYETKESAVAAASTIEPAAAVDREREPLAPALPAEALAAPDAPAPAVADVPAPEANSQAEQPALVVEAVPAAPAEAAPAEAMPDPLADLFDEPPSPMLESDFITPATVVNESAPAAPEAAAPEAAASEAATPTPVTTDKAPAPEASSGVVEKPEMTPEETKLVNEVLTKFQAKNGPKNALRAYVATDKFGSKVSKVAQAWLVAELARLA